MSLEYLIKAFPNTKSELISEFLSLYNKLDKDHNLILKELEPHLYLPKSSTLKLSEDALFYLLDKDILKIKHSLFKTQVLLHQNNAKFLERLKTYLKQPQFRDQFQKPISPVALSYDSAYYTILKDLYTIPKIKPRKIIESAHYISISDSYIINLKDSLDDFTDTEIKKLLSILIMRALTYSSYYTLNSMIPKILDLFKGNTLNLSQIPDLKLRNIIDIVYRKNQSVDFSYILVHNSADQIIHNKASLLKLKKNNLICLERLFSYLILNHYNIETINSTALFLLNLNIKPFYDKSKTINAAVKVCDTLNDTTLLAEMAKRGFPLSKNVKDLLVKNGSFTTMLAYETLSESSELKPVQLDTL